MLLDGKVAVVTGSGGGLGRAYAGALAQQGAKVVINATTPDHVDKTVEEIRKAGGQAEGCAVNISSMEGGRQLIDTAVRSYGRVDILVNNAGTKRVRPIWEMSEADFDDVIATNLKGTFACTRYAVPQMMERRWGRIINMSSGSARGLLKRSSYAATKGGIVSMTVSWAQELGTYGITCNSIRASAFTPGTQPLVKERQDAAQARGERVPTAAELGFFPPEMAAPIVVFLASEEANWINGQFIGLDGPKLTLWSLTNPIATAFIPAGWTPELLLQHFRNTVGQRLENIGFSSADGRTRAV